MKNPFVLVLLILIIGVFSCSQSKNLFFGNGIPFFEIQEIFPDERFPNIVTATDGTIVASWGSDNYRVRRSENGGKTWGPEISIMKHGFQGGGTTVDQKTGNIFLFVEERHPPAPLHVFQSIDHGVTWKEENIKIIPNSLGHTPSMHMNEHGITLKYGKYAERLIRPSRFYGKGSSKEHWDEHYTNAIFSDDNGKTWKASEPFPAYGTGEATIAELSDGTLYYNSRRHKSTDGKNPRMRYIAWSKDGGQNWKDLSVSEVLPDGNQETDYGLMGGLIRLNVKGHDILLFSNIESPSGRRNGMVWASFDGGKTWPLKKVVDKGSFAYSSLTAGKAGTSSEGMIYLLYESGKGGKVARFNLAWLTDGKDWKEFL